MNNPPAAGGAAPAAAHTLPSVPDIFLDSGVQLRPPLANVANRVVSENDIIEAHEWRHDVSMHAKNGVVVDGVRAIALSETYVTQLEVLHRAPVVSLADVMLAIANLTTVVTNNATNHTNDIARLTNDLNTLTANVANLTNTVNNLTNNVASLTRKVTQYGRLAALTYNASCGNGEHSAYAVVPNAAGEDPTDRPHLPNLPPIRRLSDIPALSHVQLTAYCNFYGVDLNGTAARLLRGVASAIGVANALRV